MSVAVPSLEIGISDCVERDQRKFFSMSNRKNIQKNENNWRWDRCELETDTGGRRIRGTVNAHQIYRDGKVGPLFINVNARGMDAATVERTDLYVYNASRGTYGKDSCNRANLDGDYFGPISAGSSNPYAYNHFGNDGEQDFIFMDLGICESEFDMFQDRNSYSRSNQETHMVVVLEDRETQESVGCCTLTRTSLRQLRVNFSADVRALEVEAGKKDDLSEVEGITQPTCANLNLDLNAETIDNSFCWVPPTEAPSNGQCPRTNADAIKELDCGASSGDQFPMDQTLLVKQGGFSWTCTRFNDSADKTRCRCVRQWADDNGFVWMQDFVLNSEQRFEVGCVATQ